MIKGIAGNLREAQSPVDRVDKSMAGIVFAKPVWVLLDDADELVAVPEWRCGEHVPDTDRPSFFSVLTKQSQDEVAHQL